MVIVDDANARGQTAALATGLALILGTVRWGNGDGQSVAAMVGGAGLVAIAAIVPTLHLTVTRRRRGASLTDLAIGIRAADAGHLVDAAADLIDEACERAASPRPGGIGVGQ